MVKPLQWTPLLVQRFWDGVAQIESMERMSFARLAGPALIEFLTPWIQRDAQLLDFGGGSGHLVELLVAAGYTAAAADPSTKREATTMRTLAADRRFLGLIAPSEPRAFDFVVCTEVIEHVLPTDMLGFMNALKHRVKPGGKLLLSTPFQEDLGIDSVYCPVCDNSFHRWQHQRAWSVAQICALMQQHGFVTDWVGLVGFDDVMVIRDFNLRQRLNEDWVWRHVLPDGQVVPIVGSGNHIIYIGRTGEQPLSLEGPERLLAAAERLLAAGIQLGRTVEQPLSLEEPERLLAAGIQHAQRFGTQPIAVVPSRSVNVEAHTVIVASDLLGMGHESSEAPPDTARTVNGMPRNGNSMLVFPASLECLERAVADGHLPGTVDALVFEGGEWRRAKPSAPQALSTPTKAQRAMAGPPAWIDRRLIDITRALREFPWARRLQPRFDRREEIVAATLQRPGNFPFRMSRVIEGRVLLAVGTLGSGGAERQLVNTAEGLVARGVKDVHVLVNYLYDDPSKAFYLDRARAVAGSVHETPKIDYSGTAWMREHAEFRDALGDGLISLILNDAEVVRRLSPEVVHASLDWTSITVGMAAVLAGVPYVFLSGRNLSPLYFSFFQWFMYPCYRALSRCSGVHLLNNSDAGRRDYAAWLRLEPGRIAVLRNGLHTGDFAVVDETMHRESRESLKIPTSSRVVVGAFRFSPEKRPLLWIDTAARILKELPDARFLLCGVGPQEAEMRARASAKGLDGRIQFLGARNDIRTILGAADLVLQTSLQEGTPNVLIEAQACGIPVVTTPAFGAAEAVEDGVSGRVVSGTAAALAEASLAILRDDSARARMREAGPRFVEARFGFDRMIQDTLAAYANAGASWADELLPAELRYRDYVKLTEIRPDSGKGWVASLPSHRAFADSLTHPDRSKLVLIEDERVLGPAHAMHEVVRSVGKGTYSHWGDVLYFSSSDNSDPTRNGRRYAVYFAK
jgi:glycosyltransferase involved in cell wall biosynthesis/2-polyprenyl-3-methyl-5-hydroxy-6-metoxy-1,4-benzoquinol methylase